MLTNSTKRVRQAAPTRQSAHPHNRTVIRNFHTYTEIPSTLKLGIIGMQNCKAWVVSTTTNVAKMRKFDTIDLIITNEPNLRQMPGDR